jgi:MoaA/NifB/PqqE/SkfB family radical SAM enzyme
VFRFLQRLFGLSKDDQAALSVLQVEVTTRCQLKCAFCPNCVLGDKWVRGDFSWDLYRDGLAPHFSGVDWVYLQGWGEPLLHPRFWDMFRLAKKKAGQVGFTSNGVLLNGKHTRRLVDEQGDLIDISFSGNRPHTHETLRRGSKFSQLKQNVQRLADMKAQANSSRPLIVLSYLLTKPSITELPAFIDTAAAIGADEVVAINLDYTPYPVQDELKAFNCADEPALGYEALLQEAAQRARRNGLLFRSYPLSKDGSMLVCDARPLDTVFINQRGDVTPCTYLGMAVEGEIPRIFCGQMQPTLPVTYGNVADGLPEVLNGPTAQVFRESFARRQSFASPAATFLNLTEGATPEVPPPPPQCVHCHKLYKL